MQLTGLDRLLWAASFAGHVILLAVLIVRRVAPRFPIFTTWISVNIANTIVLFFTFRMGSTGTYFYTYWAFAILDAALQLAVAYELASHVFQPLGVWAPDVRRSFAAIVGAGLVIALILTWLGSPPTRTVRLAIVLRGNFLASVLMSEICVAMVALSVTLGLPWKTHVARLAQALGVWAIFGIFSDAALSYFGTARGSGTFQFVSHLRIGLYLVCLAYWIVTLSFKEPAPRQLPEQLHQQLRVLQSRTALILSNLRFSGRAS